MACGRGQFSYNIIHELLFELDQRWLDLFVGLVPDYLLIECSASDIFRITGTKLVHHRSRLCGVFLV